MGSAIAKAPQGRLRELVQVDLPAAPAIGRKPSSRARTPQTYTRERASYDKTEVSPKASLDNRGASLARAHILVRLWEDPDISQAMLAEELGWGQRSAVSWHLKRLESQQLVEKVGRGQFVLTVPGKATAGEYLPIYAAGPSLWSRLIPDQFGERRQVGALAVKQAAKRLDLKYRERDGFMRRRRAGKGELELERKASYAEVVEALRACKTYKAAADKCGLRPQTFQQKLEILLRHAVAGGDA